MSRNSRYALLGVLGAGVFLAGLELMVTAVALPSIILDLAERPEPLLRAPPRLLDRQRLPARLRRRDAAGRPPGRRLGRAAAVPRRARAVHDRVAARRPGPDDRRADRRPARPGRSAAAILVPVGTAAAAHLFEGHARPRALGVIGALTFLGMAAGPFVGAAILGGLHVEGALESLGAAPGSALHALFAPSWRWVFYINVPIGICALLVAWAASARLGDAATERRHRRRRRDHLDGRARRRGWSR